MYMTKHNIWKKDSYKNIPSKMIKLSREEAGIFLGTTPIKCRGFNLRDVFRPFYVDFPVIKPEIEDGHISIFGGSNSGKSSDIVIPTLIETWTAPFVAIDIKGELKREYDKRPHRRKTKLFSLTDKKGCSYDPFDYLRKCSEKDLVANICELSNALIPLPIDVREPFWIQSAQNLLTAAILYYLDSGLIFIDTMIEIMTTPPANLIKKIGESENTMAKIFINNLIADIDENDAEDTGDIDIQTLSDSKMLIGIGQEITNNLSIFASDQRVIDALTPSKKQIHWDKDVKTYNIFISVPEDRLEQYGRVLSMILTQLIRILERRPEKHSADGAKQKQVLLMFDEFPRYKLEVITSAISTLRSKKVTIVIVCQSLAQLDKLYGEKTRRIILDNCSYVAILRANDAETQEYFSKIVGMTSKTKNSLNMNYDSFMQVAGYSQQLFDAIEPIIYPHEFATLPDIVLITPKGYCRIDKAPYYRKSEQRNCNNAITEVLNFIECFIKKFV